MKKNKLIIAAVAIIAVILFMVALMIVPKENSSEDEQGKVNVQSGETEQGKVTLTNEPDNPSEPIDSNSPEGSDKPVTTNTPTGSKEPEDGDGPSESKTPGESKRPTESDKPVTSKEPVDSKEPQGEDEPIKTITPTMDVGIPQKTKTPVGTMTPEGTITLPNGGIPDVLIENDKEVTDGFNWSEIPKVIATTKAPDGHTVNIYEGGKTYYELHDLDNEGHVTVGGECVIFEADIDSLKFETYKTKTQEYEYTIKIPKGYEVIENYNQLIVKNGWEQFHVYLEEGKTNIIYKMKINESKVKGISYDTGDALYLGNTGDNMSLEYDKQYEKVILPTVYNTGSNEVYCDAYFYLRRKTDMEGLYGYGQPLRLEDTGVECAISSIYNPKAKTTAGFLCFSKKYTKEQMWWITKIMGDSLTVDKSIFLDYDLYKDSVDYYSNGKLVTIPRSWRTVNVPGDYLYTEPYGEKIYFGCVFKKSDVPESYENLDRYIIDRFILGEMNAKQASYELSRLEVEGNKLRGMKRLTSQISITPKNMKTQDMFEGKIEKMCIDKFYDSDVVIAMVYYGTYTVDEAFASFFISPQNS